MMIQGILIIVGAAIMKLASAQTSPMPTTAAPLQFTYCPDNIAKDASYGKDTAQANWGSPQLNYPPSEYVIQSSHSAGQELTVKVGSPVDVTYTATRGDEAVSCIFTITAIDKQNPSIDCPINPFIANVHPSSSSTGAVVEFNINVQDNTGPSNLNVRTAPFQSGDVFPFGITLVTVNASDASGNFFICNFNVIVRVLLECTGTCADLIIVDTLTQNSMEVSWPQETDPSTSVQYFINYWPDGHQDRRMNLTSSLDWNLFTYTYTNAQSLTGLQSGTLYIIEITKRFPNGTESEVGTIMQRTKPDPVDSIKASEITTTSAKVSWTSDQNGVDQFRVYFYQNGRIIEAGYFPRDVNTAILTGLLPSPIYTNNTIIVTVVAISGSGKEMSTSELSHTFSTKKLPSPDKIEVINVTESSIAFAWQDQPQSQQSEPYLIYLFDDKNEQLDFVTKRQFSSNNPSYQFTGLQPLTTYTIVFLKNGLYAFKTSTTQKTRPQRISNLHAEEVQDDSFLIAWERPRGVYPDEYRIFISPHDNASLPRPIKLETYTEFEFQGLKNSTEYHVTVVSVEEGTESIPVSMTITTGIPVFKSPENYSHLTIPIIIGSSLGVFIIFLIIIIFYLLCLIPCGAVPPQKRPTHAHVNGSTQNDVVINAYAHANSNGSTQASGNGNSNSYNVNSYAYADSTPQQEQTRLPPFPVVPVKPPLKPKGRLSSAGLIEMEQGPAQKGLAPYENKVFTEEIYVNVFGRAIKPGKSIFKKKDRPVIDDQQIYDDVPESDNPV